MTATNSSETTWCSSRSISSRQTTAFSRSKTPRQWWVSESAVSCYGIQSVKDTKTVVSEWVCCFMLRHSVGQRHQDGGEWVSLLFHATAFSRSKTPRQWWVSESAVLGTLLFKIWIFCWWKTKCRLTPQLKIDGKLIKMFVICYLTFNWAHLSLLCQLKYSIARFHELRLTRELTKPRVGVIPSLFLG